MDPYNNFLDFIQLTDIRGYGKSRMIAYIVEQEMFFNKFRKIVQDYYREYNISPFPSQKKYKELRKDYWSWAEEYSPEVDDDVSVAQFLDTREDLMLSNGINTVSINTIDCWNIPAPCAPCKPTPTPPYPWKKGCISEIKKEVENTMTTVNTERAYLNTRLNETRYALRDVLAQQFRIYNAEGPQNYKELIDAIVNKTYTLDTKKTSKVDAAISEGSPSGYGPFYGIKFNLATAPDFDGYNAAEKALNKATQAAKDIINTSDAAAGLKALQDFEAWTYVAPVVTPTAQ